MASASRFVCDRVKNSTYKGVETLENIAASIGMPVESLVKLNANENVYGAPAAVLEEVSKTEHWMYPDPTQAELRAALSKLHGADGVTEQNVVAGAGSDDILDVVLRVVSPESIVICTPTFGMYSFLGKASGINVIEVPRLPDFNVDVPAVVAAIREHKATLCFLPSPNNPTGTVLPNADAETILKEDCLLVVDEAYADFCDTTAMPLLATHQNLMVCRTFSKWAGLAGLRLGYGVGHVDLVTPMMAIKQPYNVNTASEAAGLAALRHRDEIMVSVRALRAEKDRMFKRLTEEISWLRPVKSDANFVLNEVLGIPAHDVYQALYKRGVIIRYFGKQGGDLSNYIRISAGKPEDTDRVMTTLKEIGNAHFKLAPEVMALKEGLGILFDMDGVLADVTHSQHAAIIQTAKLYGVEIGEEDIGRAKAKGNANNDWQVTVDLVNAALRERGEPEKAELKKVTEQWEALYQGTDGKPGLWQVETLLVDRALLQQLAAKYPVGLVTGRPRADAERFLTQHGISDCFRHAVCLGEAASKPAPDGVKLCMEKLSVKTAVLVGDTPDDIRAACSAGIVGLGVVAPTEVDKVAAAKVLTDCGATQVLSEGAHELVHFL